MEEIPNCLQRKKKSNSIQIIFFILMVEILLVSIDRRNLSSEYDDEAVEKCLPSQCQGKCCTRSIPWPCKTIQYSPEETMSEGASHSTAQHSTIKDCVKSKERLLAGDVVFIFLYCPRELVTQPLR